MQRFSVLKSRYFQRLYLTFLAFFLVVGTCIILFVNTTLDTSIKERELSNMKEKLSLLEPLATQIFASTDYSDAEIIFSNTYKFTKIRFTLFKDTSTPFSMAQLKIVQLYANVSSIKSTAIPNASHHFDNQKVLFSKRQKSWIKFSAQFVHPITRKDRFE